MTVKPIVTVVIPCYNYAEFVGRAIKSVQSQTVNNLECFIIDDGSQDESNKAVLEAIKGDARFQYIHQNNAGVAVARNNGVFRGTGKYVCCLDADDQLDPKFLEACITYLEDHPEYGIAYTGLYAVTEDGNGSLSQWPEDSNYDKQLEGKNQIPTCNVARREMWERLGGQRQRYAPQGAGEEDAELWLRAGAYGFRAKKVTDAGLFIYSWRTGRVSGNKEHRMTDYRSWHPWTKDSLHPFASVATPEKFSHPVRQYDAPIVSVIIPVGPGHDELVIGALDSVEMQGFRNWEVILAWDNDASYEGLQRTYPYARIIDADRKGAGAARNRAVEASVAPLLLFLDADDWLMPDALQKMLVAFSASEDIVYTDYVGKAFINEKLYNEYVASDRILSYDPKDGLAAIAGKAKDYECSMAVNQPDSNMYIWNLVTSLVPKVWHNEVGGFDEEMKSWEDWDYYIRLAKAGKCFYRVPEMLVVYRYYSGERRETGLHGHKDLLKYMKEKYKKVKTVACNCGKKNGSGSAPPTSVRQYPAESQTERTESMADADYVLVVFDDGNVGQHLVVGPSSGKRYGYRASGDEFLVLRRDAEGNPQKFKVKRQQQTGVASAVEAVIPEPETIAPPKPLVEPAPVAKHSVIELADQSVRDGLAKAGITTIAQLSAASVKAIQEATGLSVHKSRALRQSARGK